MARFQYLFALIILTTGAAQAELTTNQHAVGLGYSTNILLESIDKRSDAFLRYRPRLLWGDQYVWKISAEARKFFREQDADRLRFDFAGEKQTDSPWTPFGGVFMIQYRGSSTSFADETYNQAGLRAGVRRSLHINPKTSVDFFPEGSFRLYQDHRDLQIDGPAILTHQFTSSVSLDLLGALSLRLSSNAEYNFSAVILNPTLSFRATTNDEFSAGFTLNAKNYPGRTYETIVTRRSNSGSGSGSAAIVTASEGTTDLSLDLEYTHRFSPKHRATTTLSQTSHTSRSGFDNYSATEVIAFWTVLL